jgi:hypothetical protein
VFEIIEERTQEGFVQFVHTEIAGIPPETFCCKT